MSKLKTVWDAVNELRGDLNNTLLFGADDIYLFYCIDNSDYVCSTRSTQSDNEEFVCTTAEFNALVEEMTLGLDVNSVTHGELFNYVNADKALLKKENKPLVYTQEMADNGELPSAGMECLFKIDGEYKTITVLYNSKEVMVFSYTFDGVRVEDARVKSFNHIDIKPIDTRTKKQKAIDELRNLDDSICNNIEWHANFLQAIIDGKITGVKWVGE